MTDNPETYGKHSRTHACGWSVSELLRRTIQRGDAIRLAWRESEANAVDSGPDFPTAVLPVIGDDHGIDEATEPTTATREARQWLDTERFSWWPKPLAG